LLIGLRLAINKGPVNGRVWGASGVPPTNPIGSESAPGGTRTPDPLLRRQLGYCLN
jgi:hypothetical protein